MKILMSVTCPFCGESTGTERTLKDADIEALGDGALAYCEAQIGEVGATVACDAYNHILRCEERP